MSLMSACMVRVTLAAQVGSLTSDLSTLRTLNTALLDKLKSSKEAEAAKLKEVS